MSASCRIYVTTSRAFDEVSAETLLSRMLPQQSCCGSAVPVQIAGLSRLDAA
jgi:hypothetical protein